MGTYALCGAASFVAPTVGSIACNAVTMPRTLDCVMNSLHCHRQGCGLVGMQVKPNMRPMFRQISRAIGYKLVD